MYFLISLEQRDPCARINQGGLEFWVQDPMSVFTMGIPLHFRFHHWDIFSVLDAFRNYFEKGILKYPQYKTHSIHLTGSIAHYFSEEIRKIGKEMGIQIGEITQSPGKGLVEYHLSAADQLP